MGLFNFWKKSKPEEDYKQNILELTRKLFPKWKQEIDEMGRKIMQVVHNKITLEEAGNCYMQTKIRLFTRTIWGMAENIDLTYVRNIIDQNSNWKLTSEEVWKIFWYLINNDWIIHECALTLWLLD